MKKSLALMCAALLAGCLVTETRKIEMKRQPGDIWWRDSTAAVVTSGCRTARPQSDEEYFEENSFLWPEDWNQRHPQPAKKEAPSGQLEPEAAPQGDLY